MTHPTRADGSNHRFACVMLRAAFAALFVLGLLLAPAVAAEAVQKEFDLPAGEAAVRLKEFAAQSGEQLLYAPDDVAGVRTQAVKGTMTARTALETMVAGTNLKVVQDRETGALALKGGGNPNGSGAAPAGDRPGTILITADAPVVLDSVEVTGSRIRGLLEGSSAQPVLTIDRAQIDRTGAQSIGDVLRYIPQVSSFTLGQGQTQNQRNSLINMQTGQTTFTAGATQITGAAGLVTATIRGAPAGATLLLIDGKRAPKSNQSRSADGFDLNGIPLAAVERIEVLLDGASSVYGADAMGGVINVILKKQYSGTEVRVGYENTFDTDVGVLTGSLAHGFSAGKLRGLVTAAWEESNELMLRDRDFIASFDRRPYGGIDMRSSTMPGGAGRVSRTGTVPLPGLTATQSAIPAGTTGTGLTVANYAAAGAIAAPYDVGQYSQYAASYDRYSVLAKFDYTVRDWLNLYASARFARNRNFQFAAPVQAVNLSIPAGYPGNPFGIPITLNKTFLDLQPGREATNETEAFTLGADGRLPGGWRYDLAISRADSHTYSDGDAGTSIVSTLFTAAVAAGQQPNLFYDGSIVANPNAAGVIEALTSPTRDEEEAQTWVYALQFDGPIWSLPGGDLAAAIGLERREEYADFPLRLPTDTQTAMPGSIDVMAYFAEVNVPVFGGDFRRPLLQQLNLSISYRMEDYGAGSVSRNPRAGLAWRPAAWLLVRGSYGEGFKVPTLQQRTQPNTVSNSSTAPVASNLDPARGNTVNPIHPVTRGGKADLRPETSENTTFGLVVEVPVVSGLSLSFDWFDNLYNDRIGTLLFSQMALLYPERISRGAKLPTDQAAWLGPVTAADLRPINVAYSQITGYDIGLKYDRRLAGFDLQAGLTGTKYTRNVFIPTPGGVPSPTVNTDSLPVQVNGNLFVARAAWGAGVLATYRAANRVSADRAVTPSAIRWDCQLNYDFAKAAWVKQRDSGLVGHALRDTKLSLTIFNVLNTQPPFDDLFFPDNTVLDSRLRRFALSLSRTF
ncbi:MAG: TonB-dependent receptor [Opitutaceae bacterium]|nr:TonB-dependent receptor [Opitutaceae bacterium]